MKIGDMELQIHKTWYNKTKVQEDGITHIVDPTSYPVYQFGMAKNYFDIEDRAEVTKAIITDLKEVARHLEQMLNQELDKEKDENVK